MPSAAGRIAALYRHPVKGFTPERLQAVTLQAGGFFPCDRIYAVEDGPSGFDPQAPAFIPKSAFTVLMRLAEVAKARTVYDEASGVLTVTAEGRARIVARLTEASGRKAFAEWLADLLGPAAAGPLNVVSAPGHRFTDHPQGHVSVINLQSVRELEQRTGWRIDPLRFRANLYVEGWPAWVENDAVGDALRLGAVEARIFKPITRCAATEVDPSTAERDLPIPQALREHYGHVFCGIYAHIAQGGALAEGDPARL
jgi:uncharacterized protein YcbX